MTLRALHNKIKDVESFSYLSSIQCTHMMGKL